MTLSVSLVDIDWPSHLDPLLTCVTLEPDEHAAGLRGRWGVCPKKRGLAGRKDVF